MRSAPAAPESFIRAATRRRIRHFRHRQSGSENRNRGIDRSRPQAQQRPAWFRATALLHARYLDFIFKQVTGNSLHRHFRKLRRGPAHSLQVGLRAHRDANSRGAELMAQLDVTPRSPATACSGSTPNSTVVRADLRRWQGEGFLRIAPMGREARVLGVAQRRMVGGSLGVLHAFTQNDIALNETSTAGYNLLKAEVERTIAHIREGRRRPR